MRKDYAKSCVNSYNSVVNTIFIFISEAKYAFKCKKPIIPIKVEEDYEADGWLGILTATKKYIRAYDDDVLDKDMLQLLRELGNKGRFNT